MEQNYLYINLKIGIELDREIALLTQQLTELKAYKRFMSMYTE